MDKRVWFLILFLIVIVIGLITLKYYASKPQENFAMVDVCSKGVATIIKRSMGLEDGDNSLPAELLTAKCISVSDFRKMTEAGLMSKSSVLTTLYNLFQSMDSDKPYIDKLFDWKIKDNNGALVPVDWSAKLDASGSTNFQGTVRLLTDIIIPMVIKLRDIFKDIVSSTEMATKYNTGANSANRAFINGFLAKYADFDENSGSRLKSSGTEENIMFKSLTDRIDYRDPLITSGPLKNVIKDFAYNYLLKVNFNAATQCNINIIDTTADNDIKLYIRLKKLFDLWRGMKKTGSVAFTVGDLNGSAFQNSVGDYSKAELVKYFMVELKNPKINGALTDEEHVAQVMNKMINDAFITDGGINDGRLISDPECKSDVGKLLCNIRIVDEKICKPNVDACIGATDFNQYCTAVGEILKSAADTNSKPPTLDLTKLPTTPTTSLAAGTTTAATGSGLVTSVTTTTAAVGSGSVLGSGASAGGLPGASASGGAGAPLTASAGGSGSGSASNQALQAKLGQYSIPAYLDRSTQELLVFVYDKLAASYNFDDEDVPDDIKQAISQLPPSGKANICNRYCQLTTRCNGICKLAGCMNCQVGTGAQAGSDADGAPSSSLGYAGVDDDYNLLGFLDDISQSKLISGSSGSVSGSGDGVNDQYKHMGPMISQKDTSGVSNIFAPYIIMAPKKDGSAYGAYLLDDPNDPNYRQYIDDLVKSY